MAQTQKTVNFITLGCSKNTVDSEVLAAQFEKLGYKVLHDSPANSEIVIVNTCSFINDAKEQAIDEIFVQVRRKKAGEIKNLYVIGCLAERYKDDLLQSMKEVDLILGFSELHQLLEVEKFDLLQQRERVLSTPKHYAYLKISEGCDRECSYCAIPKIRGKQVSKPIDMIVEETKMLAERGVKEVMLIAQDLTYYGMDLTKTRTLEPLLRRIASVPGIEWIRLHYAYPMGFPYEILDVMNEYSNICKYLDIPLQHINTDILRSMRRGSTSEQIYKLIENFRNKVPGIALRTSLISGYPTETRKEHKELLEFVRAARFERLGVFPYSQEENTPAYDLGDPHKQREKNKRVREIMQLQEEISLELNQKKVNSLMKVIIDDADQNFYIGRTEFDSPDVDNAVLIDKSTPLTIGEFYPVLITRAEAYDLYGKVIISNK